MFFYNTMILIVSSLCFLGFLLLFLLRRERFCLWCPVMFATVVIQNFILYMSEFLPVFAAFYTLPSPFTILLVTLYNAVYILCYRMILLHWLEFPVVQWERIALIVLFLFVPIAALLPFTQTSRTIYNSLTYVYTLYIFGYAAHLAGKERRPVYWRLKSLLCWTMLALEALSWVEDLLYIQTGVYYLNRHFPFFGLRSILYTLIDLVLNAAGLSYIAWRLRRTTHTEPPAISGPTTQELHAFCTSFKLTAREEEVFLQLWENKKIAEIAAALFISQGTVKAHIHNIFVKTGTKNQNELKHLISTQ